MLKQLKERFANWIKSLLTITVTVRVELEETKISEKRIIKKKQSTEVEHPIKVNNFPVEDVKHYTLGKGTGLHITTLIKK